MPNSNTGANATEATTVTVAPAKTAKKAAAPKKAAPAKATTANAAKKALIGKKAKAAKAEGKTKAPVKKAIAKSKGKAVKGGKLQNQPHAPWSLHGHTGHREPLKGFKEGDKVRIEVNGKKVTAEFAYFKISPIRYPEGKLFIRYKGALVKRVLSAVEKVS